MTISIVPDANGTSARLQVGGADRLILKTTEEASAPKLQAGLSTTPANNFILDPSSDNGTCVLKRESGTVIATVKANGVVTAQANQVAFKAHPSASSGLIAGSQVIATGLVIKDFDTTNAFNTATARYVPQVAGYYDASIVARIVGSGTVNYGSVTVRKNGTDAITAAGTPFSGTTSQTYVAGTFFMNGTTDYVEYLVDNGSTGAGTLVLYVIEAKLIIPT